MGCVDRTSTTFSTGNQSTKRWCTLVVGISKETSYNQLLEKTIRRAVVPIPKTKPAHRWGPKSQPFQSLENGSWESAQAMKMPRPKG